MLSSIFALSLVMTGTTPQSREPKANVAVFVHGAGGGGWEWNAWRPVFEKGGWNCVNQDLVPVKSGIADTRFADYLGQVEHLARTQRTGKLVLIGASMGGILALKACESLKPDALVLVNSVGPAGIGTHHGKTYPPVIEWSTGTLKDTQDSMPDSDEATIRFAFKHWRDESGTVLSEISIGIPANKPTCPLLVVLGDQDTHVPNEVGKRMATNFQGDLKIYPGMSHVGPLLGKRAPEVAKWVLDWLEKHVR